MTPDLQGTVGLSLMVHVLDLVLHHLKAGDMEQLISDLRASVADKAQLLRSAFDATCTVKLLPITGVPQSVNFGYGQLLRQLERQQLTVAAQLQIESSSPEMDELFCRSMDSVLLTSLHVTSGLSSFTEMVTRAARSEEDPSLTRAIITIRDDTLQEVDCEVRAVACPSNPAGVVVCGLRRIGEPRAALHEEVGEQATTEEAHPAPAQIPAAPCTEGLGLGPWVLKNLMAFWVFLRADPAPTRRPTEDPEQMRQIPVTQAVGSLRRNARLSKQCL